MVLHLAGYDQIGLKLHDFLDAHVVYGPYVRHRCISLRQLGVFGLDRRPAGQLTVEGVGHIQ